MTTKKSKAHKAKKLKILKVEQLDEKRRKLEIEIEDAPEPPPMLPEVPLDLDTKYPEEAPESGWVKWWKSLW
jgi:hypothetical protein